MDLENVLAISMPIGGGGDLDDQKSMSGYVFQIGSGAVSWRSK